MNTKDFKPFKYSNVEKPFEVMFKEQKKIFYKFMEIEKNSMKNYSFDINCYEDQQLLKDFLQIRFTEELTEATIDIENLDHFREEMVDAFNFLMETYILYGYSYKDLEDWKEFDYRDGYMSKKRQGPLTPFSTIYIYASFYGVIEQVGKACNLLKNRPWKSSQYLVDLFVFEENLKKIWVKFNELCGIVNINEKDLFEVWSLKYQVNTFRLKTRY